MSASPLASLPGSLARRRAFSLMEIILSIAVVAILAVLLMPAFGTVMEKVRAAACTQQLRQIGVALGGYISDHNGSLIPYASLGGSPQRFWFDELDPYMGMPQGQLDRTHPHPWQICPAKPVTPANRQVVGYGWNHRYLGYNKSDPRGGPALITQISRPAECIVIGDSIDISNPTYPPAISDHRYLFSQSVDILARRHAGKGFYLLLDGHVMSASPEELVDTGTGAYRLYWRKKR